MGLWKTGLVTGLVTPTHPLKIIWRFLAKLVSPWKQSFYLLVIFSKNSTQNVHFEHSFWTFASECMIFSRQNNNEPVPQVIETGCKPVLWFPTLPGFERGPSRGKEITVNKSFFFFIHLMVNKSGISQRIPIPFWIPQNQYRASNESNAGLEVNRASRRDQSRTRLLCISTSKPVLRILFAGVL